ncbi:PEP-CTERM sorting domain-containing protein [Acidiphilium acidophilum]|uniref:PEP-CTERM sorting domain-containing protein n=1 Tax=Acidiphilium acidophilum TaxID=76588 RepID=A0AAW9DKP8_ACIAO|nr:PEP-CTERM sorting domain-containing protein [Acidiphilium acidophilum]MDX5929684.1 PEP-CTERM sorting domain-containing protein [Acidiphilium acidophilum]
MAVKDGRRPPRSCAARSVLDGREHGGTIKAEGQHITTAPSGSSRLRNQPIYLPAPFMRGFSPPPTVPVPKSGSSETLNYTNFLTFGSTGQYTFSLTSLSNVTANGGLILQGLGLFSDSTGNLGTNLSSEVSFALSQTNSQGATGISTTFSVPPSMTNVPEPGSLALLGTALITLGLIIRRNSGKPGFAVMGHT